MTESFLVPIIPFQQARLGLSTKRRANTLIERSTAALGGPPDIVHMFGGSVLKIGAEVARQVSAVPAIEIWRPNIEASARIAANRARGAIRSDADAQSARGPLLIAPTGTIKARLEPQFPDGVVREIPWGVHAAGARDESDRELLSLILLGPGRDGRAWQAGFRAAVRMLKSNKRVHLFADADAARRHHVWPEATQAGVLSRLSLMDNAELRRDLALRADLLLFTDARGESRTILLDAMASGVTVLAATDPLADSLIDGKTARLVTDPTEAQWCEAIEQMIADDAARKRLAESSAAYVQEHHRASRQIVSLIDAYEWVAGDPVRIGPVSAAPLGPDGL